MSFFRYPGGKKKLRYIISRYLNEYSKNKSIEYREPFFGGGSIGINFILDNPFWKKIWLNDKDSGISNLWTSVIRYPEDLKKIILDFIPSIEKFDEYKFDLLNNDEIYNKKKDILDHGFKKLAIHQMSYSGLGTKSGGPLGGRSQESKYKIDCRWSPEYLCKKIDNLHKIFLNLDIKHNVCTNLDFSELILCDTDSFLYLDPPYYMKGNDLYQHGFSEMDHKRLSDLLRDTKNFWLLSYDDCKEVRDLYSWAEIDVISVNYNITSIKEKESGKRLSTNKDELLIYPRSLDV